MGGAFDTTTNSSHCGAIWKLTNPERPELLPVDFISIDNAVRSDFGLSLVTFAMLGGTIQTKTLTLNASIVEHLEVSKG
jgi:hypothetical protein